MGYVERLARLDTALSIRSNQSLGPIKPAGIIGMQPPAHLDVHTRRSYALSTVVAKTHYPVDADVVMRELCRADRHLARVIRKVGSFPTKKQTPQPPFESLLRAIVYQQLAGAAAAAVCAIKSAGTASESEAAAELRRNFRRSIAAIGARSAKSATGRTLGSSRGMRLASFPT